MHDYYPDSIAERTSSHHFLHGVSPFIQLNLLVKFDFQCELCNSATTVSGKPCSYGFNRLIYQSILISLESDKVLYNARKCSLVACNLISMFYIIYIIYI